MKQVRFLSGILLLRLLLLLISVAHSRGRVGSPLAEIAISYSYFQKDDGQRDNFDFFIDHGIGGLRRYPLLQNTDVVIIVSGSECSPCSKLPIYDERHRVVSFEPEAEQVWKGRHMVLMFRSENVGMDIAAHNATLEYFRLERRIYKYYIFLNSSTRGPFYPSYMPAGWQWPHAYISRFTPEIKVVSSSLVCLPKVDVSGAGPRVESWAFALDAEGLRITVGAGVFVVRTCKLCIDSGIVAGGEYGISKAILDKGYNLATLQSMYKSDVDWADPQHWNCNDNVHPSRHGTYDGISMHPFETVFIKASWRVGEPHLTKYTQWFREHARGGGNTAGAFNETMYFYAAGPRGIDPPSVEKCFLVPV